MTNNTFLTSYQRIEGNEDEFERDDDLSRDSLIRVVPKPDNTRWNHIEDLDSFFTRVYQYHQEFGLLCMTVKWIGEIFKFLFITLITVFVSTSINYKYLFKKEVPKHYEVTHKIFISDCIINPSEAWRNMPFSIFILLIVALIYLIIKIFLVVISYFQFKDIQRFFNVALGFSDNDLENITWEDVQQRLMEVQIEQRMCIHKESLSELDIYHRILRFENYFIAMVNKNIFPLKINFPLAGEYVFLSRGLRYSIDFILFTGIDAPFKSWHLRDDYKRYDNRHQLAEVLSKRILYVGIGIFILSPFVFIFQILRSFYYYTSKIKSDPRILGTRRWSHYGHASLRHYNELNHEFQARLKRAHKHATKYLDCFSKPLVVIIAQDIAFTIGSILTLLVLFTVYDEDVIQVSHVLTLMSIFGCIIAFCASQIPDENLVSEPELEISKILAHVHYLPDTWRGKAHTKLVLKEFSYLFQYKVYHVIESALSPLITPYILCFRLRHKSLAIVDFLRNFTVEVTGVGDICSFAQMDIRKHGSHTWDPRLANNAVNDTSTPDKDVSQTDNGRTELSLLHFAFMNPRWKPPKEASEFLHALRTQARREFNDLPILRESPLLNSVASLSLGESPLDLENGLIRSMWLNNASVSGKLIGNLNHMEGSRHVPSNGVLGSLSEMVAEQRIGSSRTILNSQRIYGKESFTPFLLPARTQDITPMDMNVSALYLNGLHQRQKAANNYTDSPVYLQINPTVQPDTRQELQPSTYLESCYNSSDPPSVEESYNFARPDIPNNYPLNNEDLSSQPQTKTEDVNNATFHDTEN